MSYQELKDNLSFVFKAVAGEEIRPQIHIRNTTQVCLGTRFDALDQGDAVNSLLKPVLSMTSLNFNLCLTTHGAVTACSLMTNLFLHTKLLALCYTQTLYSKIQTRCGNFHTTLEVPFLGRDYKCSKVTMLCWYQHPLQLFFITFYNICILRFNFSI